MVVLGAAPVHAASLATAEPSLAVHVWVLAGVEAFLPQSPGQSAAISTQLYVTAAGCQGQGHGMLL